MKLYRIETQNQIYYINPANLDNIHTYDIVGASYSLYFNFINTEDKICISFGNKTSRDGFLTKILKDLENY